MKADNMLGLSMSEGRSKSKILKEEFQTIGFVFKTVILY